MCRTGGTKTQCEHSRSSLVRNGIQMHFTLSLFIESQSLSNGFRVHHYSTCLLVTQQSEIVWVDLGRDIGMDGEKRQASELALLQYLLHGFSQGDLSIATGQTLPCQKLQTRRVPPPPSPLLAPFISSPAFYSSSSSSSSSISLCGHL